MSNMRAFGTCGSCNTRQVVLQQRCTALGVGSVHSRQQSRSPKRLITCMAADIQFIKGINEPSVPDVNLTRSRDGTNGTATFVFNSPSIFEASSELGDITGLYLVDDEGTLSTVEVSAKFVNGKPDRIEAKYVMKSRFQWDRFMRFMERYAEDKELGFTKKE